MSHLARRSGISSGLMSDVMSGKVPASANFCAKIADGLGESREKLFRLAGILPTLPPKTEQTKEATTLFGSLDEALRHSMITTMKNLLGLRAQSRTASLDPGPIIDPQPPERDRVSQRLVEELSTMTPEDQQLVFDLMRRLRGSQDRGRDVATD